MAEKNPITLIDERSLKTVFRGYERKATDDLLEELKTALVAIMVERDAALARVEQLENGLDALRRLEGQITDVLAIAARIRGESENRAEELIRGAEAERNASCVRRDPGPVSPTSTLATPRNSRRRRENA